MAPASKLSKEDALDRSYIAGKTVLLTGGTSGLGEACIEEIIRYDASQKPEKMILVARNPAKAEETAAKLTAAGIASSIYYCDNLKPAEVLRAAAEIAAKEPVLHVAMLNAGTWEVAPRKVQENGLEIHYCANFLQMAILADTLSGLISKSSSASSKGRICVMGSFTTMQLAKGTLDFDSLKGATGPSFAQQEGGYTYSQTKLAQHVWVKHASKTMPENVTINVCDPGAVMTNIPGWQVPKKALGCLFPLVEIILGVRTPAVGCSSFMYMAAAKKMEGLTGTFVDFGYTSKYLTFYSPVPAEQYPDQYMKIAPTTVDPVLCEKLYTETAEVIKSLQESATWVLPGKDIVVVTN
jgi:NAD(P)-dependent dehydrogenase (short-subunit alcohol dehydrogenase family)